jgi:hypothetical protein
MFYFSFPSPRYIGIFLSNGHAGEQETEQPRLLHNLPLQPRKSRNTWTPNPTGWKLVLVVYETPTPNFPLEETAGEP